MNNTGLELNSHGVTYSIIYIHTYNRNVRFCLTLDSLHNYSTLHLLFENMPFNFWIVATFHLFENTPNMALLLREVLLRMTNLVIA